MSWWLAERSIDHVVLERGEVANTWRTERWDSLALAHAELAKPAAGPWLRGRRSGRLPDDGRDDRVHRALRDAGVAAAADALPGHFRPARRRWLSGRRPTRAPGIARRSCSPPARSTSRRSRSVAEDDPVRHRATDHGPVPQPRAASSRAASGRRRGRLRCADRRRDPPLRTSRDAGGGRARSRAPDVPRPRHPVVDGRHRPERRALRRGRDIVRRARALSSFQIAGYADRRNIDLNALTSLGVALVGRLAGDPRRQGAVLRFAAQPVRARRPQA